MKTLTGNWAALLPVLVACAWSAAAQSAGPVVIPHLVSQPLLSSTPLPLSYIKGGAGGVLTTSATIYVPAGTADTPFTLDAATVPLWLTVTGGNATAKAPGPTAVSSGAATVSFSVVTTVAAGMVVGPYNVNVGLRATGSSMDLLIPISFQISNSPPTVALQEGATGTEIDKIWPVGSAVPTPTVTPYSSNEPIPFTATCAVQSSDPTYISLSSPTSCTLNGTMSGSTSGVAYTWGTPLAVSLDPALFNSSLGTTVKLTVTVTPQGSAALSLVYKYAIEPAAAKLTTISPTSAAHIASGTSLLVLLTGTGFIGPGSLKSNSGVVPTQVFVGASNTNLTANSVVLSPTQIMVAIPEADFPALTGKATSAPLAIGIANQAGSSAPTAPTATINLNITQSPVIYAISSTASYRQPPLGINPSFAAFELISIFGDNFGPTGSNIAISTLDSWGKIPMSLTVSTVALKVTFKTADGKTTYSAPILFVSENQINAIVPSGVTIGATINVSVSLGTANSDNFPVTVVAADPGIFTLASDGVGPGAILNQDATVNKVGNEAKAGDIVAIYLTGLGAPDSTAPDVAANPGGFPAGCVAISNTAKTTPGYLQVVNTAVAGYTPPSPAWTSIDGATIQAANILGKGMPPCMTAPVSVTFGSGLGAVVASGVNITYAGFVDGTITGLYQVNAKIPVGVATGSAVPVMVTIGSASSQAAVVTMAIK